MEGRRAVVAALVEDGVEVEDLALRVEGAAPKVGVDDNGAEERAGGGADAEPHQRHEADLPVEERQQAEGREEQHELEAEDDDGDGEQLDGGAHLAVDPPRGGEQDEVGGEGVRQRARAVEEPVELQHESRTSARRVRPYCRSSRAARHEHAHETQPRTARTACCAASLSSPSTSSSAANGAERSARKSGPMNVRGTTPGKSWWSYSDSRLRW